MAEKLRVGPAHIFLGNPTTAAGAGMKYMGVTRGDVTVAPGINVAMGRADQKGRTPLADGVFSIGPTPIVSIPFLDEEKAKLLKVLPGSSITGSALGLGSGFSKIALADIPTLCILPIDQTGSGTNGIDSVDAIWLPGAISTEFSGLVFNLPEGDDAFPRHEVQIAGLYREKDHGDAAIAAAARVAFVGPPSAFSLTWYLPAATA